MNKAFRIPPELFLPGVWNPRFKQCQTVVAQSEPMEDFVHYGSRKILSTFKGSGWSDMVDEYAAMIGDSADRHHVNWIKNFIEYLIFYIVGEGDPCSGKLPLIQAFNPKHVPAEIALAASMVMRPDLEKCCASATLADDLFESLLEFGKIDGGFSSIADKIVDISSGDPWHSLGALCYFSKSRNPRLSEIDEPFDIVPGFEYSITSWKPEWSLQGMVEGIRAARQIYPAWASNTFESIRTRPFTQSGPIRTIIDRHGEFVVQVKGKTARHTVPVISHLLCEAFGEQIGERFRRTLPKGVVVEYLGEVDLADMEATYQNLYSSEIDLSIVRWAVDFEKMADPGVKLWSGVASLYDERTDVWFGPNRDMRREWDDAPVNGPLTAAWAGDTMVVHPGAVGDDPEFVKFESGGWLGSEVYRNLKETSGGRRRKREKDQDLSER